jgi:hypothetical protein
MTPRSMLRAFVCARRQLGTAEMMTDEERNLTRMNVFCWSTLHDDDDLLQ